MKKLIILFSVVFIASCVDHTFDEPPGFTPEAVDANAMIGDLLDQWNPGTFVQITDELTFRGTVVANDETGNFYKQLVIQDETGGIQVRLDAIGLFNEFPVGREVIVKCKDLYISDYEGLPQLSAAEGNGSNISSIAIPEPLIPNILFNTTTTEPIEAKTLTLNGLSSELSSTLVKFENVQFSLGSVSKPLADVPAERSLNHDVEDCNENTILLRTSNFANFASEFTPAGKGSIEGILSVFRGDYQLLLRNYEGIQMDGDRCDGDPDDPDDPDNTGDPVDLVDEDFDALSDNEDINIAEWSNIAVKGTRKWRANDFDGNIYAQATAFNDNNAEMEAWLITPKIKFDAPMKMQLITAQAFYNHNGLTVWYSTNFDGKDVTSATWMPLELTIAGQSSGDHNWVDSGEVDLSSISGTAYVGFKYEGNSSNATTSYRIDDVKIVDK